MTETLKPCPLAEALELTQVHFSSEENADALRAELAKRGYAITRAPDDVAQIVAWLRQCHANKIAHHREVCFTEDDEILDAIITAAETFGYAADAIERGDWKDK